MTQHPLSPELTDQLATLRATRALAKRKHFARSRSRLDRYRAELERLSGAGASVRELTAWLRAYRRVKVHHTTVARRLAHWRALRAATDAPPLPPTQDASPGTSG